jgi:hypothetical protein
LQRTDDTLRRRSIVADQLAIFSDCAKDGSSAIREQARTSIFWMQVEAAQVIIILKFLQTFVHDFAHVPSEPSHISVDDEGRYD